jgi:hypothetical protein
MDYDNKDDITTLFLFEYVMSIEEITQNSNIGYTNEEVLKQLTDIMGKFRLSKLDREKDSDISIYRKTQDEKPKYVVDIQDGKEEGYLAGAQVFTYYENKSDLKAIVALFDTLTTEENLNRIRQVVFHELTHTMEITKKDEKTILFDDVRGDIDKKVEYDKVRSDGNVFLSSGKKYLNYEVMETGPSIFYTGLATREKVPPSSKNTSGIVMHNQITEGAVELVSREIMQTLGIADDIDYGKYSAHVRVVGRVADKYGNEEFISQFLRDSSVLIKEFETIQVKEQDGLHYLSNYVSDSFIGVTKMVKSERPFPNLARRMRLPKEKINKIRSLKFWSSTNLTDEIKDELYEEYLKKMPEESKTEYKEELANMVTEYEESLADEGKFVEEFTNKLVTKKRKTISMKALVENALEHKEVEKRVGAIDIGNLERVIKLSQDKLKERGEDFDE